MCRSGTVATRSEPRAHDAHQAVLAGDIHDTRCLAGPLTLFRFTSRDFKKEEVTRYPDPRGTP